MVVAWGWYLTMFVADRPHPFPWVEGEVEHSRVLLDGAGQTAFQESEEEEGRHQKKEGRHREEEEEEEEAGQEEGRSNQQWLQEQGKEWVEKKWSSDSS